MKFIRIAMITTFLFLILTAAVFAEVLVLPVPQRYQEKANWCWAASSEMVLEYFGRYKISQTMIAAYGTKGADTWNWLYGKSSNPTRRGVNMILNRFGPIRNWVTRRALSLKETTNLIKDRELSIIRWGWDSGGGHIIVIHGVSDNMVFVKDPWNGSFFADYNWVLSGGSHTWTDTVFTAQWPRLPW